MSSPHASSLLVIVSKADLSIPPQKAIDIYRPQWDREGNPVPPEKQETYTSRINITFRFYRDGKLILHPEADSQTFSRNARQSVNVICPCTYALSTSYDVRSEVS